MIHLVIAGHGMQRNKVFDPGAIGLIKKGEHKYVVEDLFPAMRKHLPKGHNVVLFDKYKVSNYGNIVALAKEYKATQITEIHYDAAVSTARGGHVIVHKSFAPDKTDLALRDAIDSMVGVRYNHKGHKGISGRDNLINVNQTAKAGITYRLIELGFGTNKTDADILTGKVDEYAQALVKAIVGEVNDKPTDQVSKPKPTAPTPSKPSVSKPSTNQTASIVDYLNSKGINSSPANRKKLAVEYGVKNYDLSAAKNTELLNKMRADKPVSKPKPTPKPKPKDRKLHLPKTATSWRVYPTNKAPVKANALKTKLNPKKFDGLSYKILANPQKDVYTIQTAQLGKVNIYAGPGTGATIK